MNDQDYIRKAVELADGWKPVTNLHNENELLYFIPPQWNTDKITIDATDHHFMWLDALAAQLVRQVDMLAFPYDAVFITVGNTSVQWPIGANFLVEGNNRTMNTIKAIVDSGVL